VSVDDSNAMMRRYPPTPDRARVGHEPSSGLYYEVLGERWALAFPLLLVHGAGATGACFRATPDGRLGWADRMAIGGYECWVTDWPGGGRSGNRDPVTIEYGDLVSGYSALLRDVIAEPAVIVCHSMGGAVTWKLVELMPELVRGVIAVAAAYPGNLAPRSEIVSDDGEVAIVAFADTGVHNRVDRSRMNLYGDPYIFEQAIAGSTRFPADAVEAMRAGLVGIPPRVLLARLGVIPGMPMVDNPSGFVGKRVRLVTGGEDPAHTRDIEERTVAQLRAWGADAELVWLPDHGIEGNGHFLFFETNSDRIVDLVLEQVHEVSGADVPRPSR
jgi:pimeloyl-ACP methyl ester carboxylesterase